MAKCKRKIPFVNMKALGRLKESVNWGGGETNRKLVRILYFSSSWMIKSMETKAKSCECKPDHHSP